MKSWQGGGKVIFHKRFREVNFLNVSSKGYWFKMMIDTYWRYRNSELAGHQAPEFLNDAAAE